MCQLLTRLSWFPLMAWLSFGCANTLAIRAQSPHEAKQHTKRVRSPAKVVPSFAPARFRLTKIRARKGDSLEAIAYAHHLSVDELRRLNRTAPDAELRTGQEVILPVWGPAAYGKEAVDEPMSPAPESRFKPDRENRLPASAPAPANAVVAAKRIRFADGTSFDVDAIWRQGEDFWYRLGGVTAQVDRPVRSIESIRAESRPESRNESQQSAVSGAATNKSKPAGAQPLWIVLQGGARMKVEEVRQTDAGVWYQRGNLSIFIEREQIARIESESVGAKPEGWLKRGWTSGNAQVDQLIRASGTRFGIDPYLVFCVIEKESQFHTHALSPKGARGLMQLMPATASRFGVRKPFDPAQNIFAGTQYLKELLDMFHGDLNLALAGYNAGEGAVLRYGGNVPPYRETRDYVRKITQRYGAD